MGLPFVSMCPRFLTRQPPNCRISGEVATNARYPEKCVSEVLPDPTLRFLRTPKKINHLIPSFCVYTHSSESVHVHVCPCHCMRTRVSLHVCSIGVSDRFRHKPRLTSSFYSVVLRLHAFFGKCTRSRVPLSLYVYTRVFACMLYRLFGSYPARAKTVICVNAFSLTLKGSGSALRLVRRARDVLRSVC